jgi:MFS family permease
MCETPPKDIAKMILTYPFRRMGFSDGIIVCALIRAFAGLMSSSIRVAMATMIGDVSTSASAKSSNFARLPLISCGGVIGPLLQAALAHRFAENNTFWRRFPIFTSQLACASLMLVVLALNLLFLEEVRAHYSYQLVCIADIVPDAPSLLGRR